MLIVLLWFTFALNYVDRQMVYAMFPALRADLGFTPERLGWIGSIFLWVYTLSMPLAGRLADRGRRDWMILASLALWSLSTLACGWSTSVNSFLSARAAMGLTESLYYPAALALIAGHYPAESRSRMLGVHQSSQLVGVMIGGWYGGWSADHIGWRSAFGVAGGVGIAYSVVLWLFFRRQVQSEAVVEARGAGDLRELATSFCYVALCAVLAAYCAMQWIFFAWFPSFLYERYRLTMTESGWNATVFVSSSVIAGNLLGGFLTDRLARRLPGARFYMTALGVFCCAPFAWLTFSADTLVLARCFSAGFGFFGGLLSANAFAAAYDVVGPRNRGMAGGVLNMMGGIASAIMIYMAGIWKDTIGFPVMTMWMMVAAMLASLGLMYTVRARYRVEAKG